MTNLRISFGLDELFVGNLMAALLLLFGTEKFGRFSPLSPTSIVATESIVIRLSFAQGERKKYSNKLNFTGFHASQCDVPKIHQTN